MKIALLSARNSRYSGGLFYSVRHLGLSLLNDFDQDVYYVCFDDEYSAEDSKEFKNLPLKKYHISNLPLLRRFGYSRDLYKVLEALRPDVIDVQGTWMYYSYVAYKYKKNNPDVKLLITPRGTLAGLLHQQMSLQKKIVYWWWEKNNLNKADCIKALCESEYKSARQFGAKAPIAIIPNGFDLPKAILKSSKPDSKKIILFLGRINPKKGLVELIKAINLIKKYESGLLKGCEFRIGGWVEKNYLSELLSLVQEYNLDEYVKFIGPKFGEDKIKELIAADAFILPSTGEGLPMAVLEAMAYKLPNILTPECNIPEAFDHKAAIKIAPNAKDIQEGLIIFLNMSPGELQKMGENGYQLVKEKFQWKAIASQTIQLCQYLHGEINQPEFVHYD